MKMQGKTPDWAQYALPDAHGHFGPYGGVFVAETLRAALDELTLAYSQVPRGCRRSRRSSRTSSSTTSAVPAPIYPREAPLRARGRRADLPQARGPEPHRRPQGEQHRGPGAARAGAWASRA